MFKVEEHIAKVEKIYSQVTGKRPKVTDTPYSPIPPEVDAETYVKEHFQKLLKTVQTIEKGNGSGIGVGVPSQQQQVPVESPKLNVFESEEHWACEVLLSGVTKSEISIQIHHGILKISALRHPKIAQNVHPIHIEATPCRYERFIPLPSHVKSDSVHAKLEDGLLHVQFKKEPISQKQEINISVS